jgi:hypothetical protein
LHCRFDGHTTPPPDELPPPDDPLLLLPPNTIPLEAPLDAPLDAPLLPLLAPPLLAPPEDPKPLPLLLPPHAGARRSATVEAKVAQLTASVRRFMTRVSPDGGNGLGKYPEPIPRRWILLPRILKSVWAQARNVCVSRGRCGDREKFHARVQCRLP